jgi:hypothetical protein
MKLIRKLRALMDYAPLVAALLPTLILLAAAGVCLADKEAVVALTTRAVPGDTGG